MIIIKQKEQKKWWERESWYIPVKPGWRDGVRRQLQPQQRLDSWSTTFLKERTEARHTLTHSKLCTSRKIKITRDKHTVTLHHDVHDTFFPLPRSTRFSIYLGSIHEAPLVHLFNFLTCCLILEEKIQVFFFYLRWQIPSRHLPRRQGAKNGKFFSKEECWNTSWCQSQFLAHKLKEMYTLNCNGEFCWKLENRMRWERIFLFNALWRGRLTSFKFKLARTQTPPLEKLGNNWGPQRCVDGRLVELVFQGCQIKCLTRRPPTGSFFPLFSTE